MNRLDSDMQAVVDQLMKIGSPPLETLDYHALEMRQHLRTPLKKWRLTVQQLGH